MRLIDADELLSIVRSMTVVDKSVMHRILIQMPTVDAVPVRYGRWETDGMMMDDGEYLMTRCTACGEAYEYGYNMPFCPHCGADMRKDGERHD